MNVWYEKPVMDGNSITIPDASFLTTTNLNSGNGWTKQDTVYDATPFQLNNNYTASNFDLYHNGVLKREANFTYGTGSVQPPDEPDTPTEPSEPDNPSEPPSEEPSEQEENLLDTLKQTNELLRAIYVAMLFVIGTVAAVFVVVLLYKFLRSSF